MLVKQSTSVETDSFPPDDAAYILRGGHQPGRNTNSYIFAHALNTSSSRSGTSRSGAEVLVRMSDDSVLRYVVTEIHPNVACPDPDADQPAEPTDPPLALQIHTDCSEGVFLDPGPPYERLTLQTSQGYNRNWGELVIVAQPATLRSESRAARARTRRGPASPPPRRGRWRRRGRAPPPPRPATTARAR